MKTITLVDDEPAFLDVMVRAVRSWNYECQAAVNAEDALALLEREQTPIVVTDLRMPGRGGVWLIEQVRRRWPELAPIIVTSGTDTEALPRCLDAGAHHYFLKPIKLDEFHHALEATLRSQRLHTQREGQRRRLEHTLKRQRRKLRRTFLSGIDALVRTLEARDPYTSGHSFRVSRYVQGLARRLGLDSSLRQKLLLAAKLHDIGKVGLPEGILNKAGLLTCAEIRKVQEHPVIGERILRPIIRSRSVLAAIRGHHECFDGSGYPDGLKGSNIPMLARIITVADCFDAMTSSRAYRQALPRDQALEFLRQGAGTQFDPAFVPPFLELILES